MFTRLGGVEGAVVDSQDNSPMEQQKEGLNGDQERSVSSRLLIRLPEKTLRNDDQALGVQIIIGGTFSS